MFLAKLFLNSFNPMKISAAAAKQFVDCCSTAGCEVSEAEAEETIGAVREFLGRKLLASELQFETIVSVLILFKALLIEKRSELVTEWSEDEWADAFWELLETSVSHTL